MEEIVKLILEYVSIWMPALVAISGVVVCIIQTINKVSNFVNTLKEDVAFKELNKKLEILTSENKELVRCNKLLLDNITKIKDYADIKKMEE